MIFWDSEGGWGVSEFLKVQFNGRMVLVRKAEVWFFERTEVETESGMKGPCWAIVMRFGGVAFHDGAMTFLLSELGPGEFLRVRGPGMLFVRKAFIDTAEHSPVDPSKPEDYEAVGLYPGPRDAGGLLPGRLPFVFHGTLEEFQEDMGRGVPIFSVN